MKIVPTCHTTDGCKYCLRRNTLYNDVTGKTKYASIFISSSEPRSINGYNFSSISRQNSNLNDSLLFSQGDLKPLFVSRFLIAQGVRGREKREKRNGQTRTYVRTTGLAEWYAATL